MRAETARRPATASPALPRVNLPTHFSLSISVPRLISVFECSCARVLNLHQHTMVPASCLRRLLISYAVFCLKKKNNSENLTLTAGSPLAVEIKRLTAGSHDDQANVTGSGSLG